ncbi:MAG: hypothetical protein RIF33_17120 [Cyclobacteriaceae bacterium]
MDLIKVFFWIYLGLTIVGLYRPWVVFWWSDFSNRYKVLRVYGIPLASLIIILLLR